MNARHLQADLPTSLPLLLASHTSAYRSFKVRKFNSVMAIPDDDAADLAFNDLTTKPS